MMILYKSITIGILVFFIARNFFKIKELERKNKKIESDINTLLNNQNTLVSTVKLLSKEIKSNEHRNEKIKKIFFRKNQI